MSFSMYDLTIPPLLRGLDVMADCMKKAGDHSAANNVAEGALVGARLAPDMAPLSGQVQRASDNSKATIGRLAAVQVPGFSDTEATLSELGERIEKTLAFLGSSTPSQLHESDNRETELKFAA